MPIGEADSAIVSLYVEAVVCTGSGAVVRWDELEYMFDPAGKTDVFGSWTDGRGSHRQGNARCGRGWGVLGDVSCCWTIWLSPFCTTPIRQALTLNGETALLRAGHFLPALGPFNFQKSSRWMLPHVPPDEQTIVTSQHGNRAPR
jgi:hypothetical protein